LITVTVPRDVVNSAVEDAYVALNKKAKVKGFRPGKIPRDVLKSIFKDQVKVNGFGEDRVLGSERDDYLF
jgi:trigger factor